MGGLVEPHGRRGAAREGGAAPHPHPPLETSLEISVSALRQWTGGSVRGRPQGQEGGHSGSEPHLCLREEVGTGTKAKSIPWPNETQPPTRPVNLGLFWL